MIDPNTLMTRYETAEYLKVAVRTLDRLFVAGDGPQATRAGKRRLLYRRSDVDDWIKSRTHKSRAAELAAA